MTKEQAREIAEKIADRLFTAGNGQIGDHLQIHQGVPPNSRYIAGWARGPVIDLIVDELSK